MIAIEEQFLKRQEVVEITGLSFSTIYRQIPKGQFPRQVRVGPRAVRGGPATSGPGWIHVHGLKEKMADSPRTERDHRDQRPNLDPLLQPSISGPVK